MASSKDKWSAVVAKLIQKTQSKKIKWTPVSLRPADSSTDTIIPSAFTVEHEGKSLRLYRIERPEIMFGTVSKGRIKKVVMEILDNSGKVLWTFPPMDSLADLISAIEFQAAGIDDYLDSLLRD